MKTKRNKKKKKSKRFFLKIGVSNFFSEIPNSSSFFFANLSNKTSWGSISGLNFDISFNEKINKNKD
jgi:hypothetical protein